MSAPADEPGNPAHAIFERFLRAGECREVLGCFVELCQQLGLQGTGLQLYHGLKAALNYWNAKALWSKLDKKAGHKDYDQGTACAGTKCLVVGAGPCGLRAAIELALLGARVVLLEKRDSFSRNNVLHLWPFTIHDLRALGAKKFYGRFCTGTLDHISIRQLQLILLKVALLLGVEVHINVRFEGLVPPTGKAGGWQAVLQPSSSPLTQYEFDVLISAGGGKFVPEGFKRKETRGKLAIGITTNFINRHSRAEVEVAEISGVARIYNQKFFQNLYNKTGIDLENIVYYKDDTHYFVMTAKKQSLLEKGVILQDKADIESLLSPKNVNRDALLSYAKEAANFSTNYCLPELEFALNHQDLPDVDVFDFTCMTRSENAALVREHNGSRLLLGLVGDCLVEPFWPLGTGVARGFLAAFDAAWMVRRWAAGTPPLEVLAERESIYQHLSQTSPDNTNKNISQYSIDPATRYPNINLQAIKASQVRDLYLVGTVEVDHKRRSDNRLSMAAPGAVCEELLSWCQASTAGYPGVAVTNFSTSWTSGLALCALIHHFRPDLVDFDSVDPQDPVQIHQAMLDIAEQELGIQPVLSSAEMATMTGPDHLDLITYLSHFYQVFSTSPEVEVSERSAPSPRGTRGAILFLSKLQKSRNLAHKRAQDGAQKDTETKRSRRDAELDTGLDGDAPDSAHEPPQSTVTEPGQPPRERTGENSDACYFCGRRVYILERASAEGRFFHRGCFQCRRCGATLRLGDYAFDEEDGHFYCSLHYPNAPSTDLPRDEAPALLDGDAGAAAHPLPDAGSPRVPPMEWTSSPVQPTPAAPQAGEEPGEVEDTADAGDTEEQEPLAQPGGDVEVPRAEPQGTAEEGEESGGRRKIVLTPLERLNLSTLNLTSEAEPEPPLKPARLRLHAAPEALPAPWQGQGACKEEEEKIDMEKDLEESDSEEEEEEEEKEEDEGTGLGIMKELYPDPREEEKYPTWKRTLARRARESQMKRFCRAQAIQRRLEEIEVTFRELEQQGIKLEKLLRDKNKSPAEQQTQWTNQLLYLVQKKNNLVTEESDLMIAVQELKLEEQQCQLDETLRSYMNKEDALKTAEDEKAEQEILKQLVEVVNKRNILIQMQEEKRLSELRA
ncbi:F-actin-monooxygenase MICAL1 isoform X1 [Hirundo rustica]|uniref:F-actin-monooxygenase MICAL1 isoform X1 n=1 Tax=Hirundo rustica TaxID=43150 RepID=UPI001A951391|nr:F-actin-monooxygenase MICAL1 isoform X1 [Hirundo rustica]XP_039941276.1 F-actin-monooxygenase MICAL1 isoform X1 [Hirundo rustica]XP_058279409.1 F-actin-monooxygenase MICAL1 isoform X1 [Hirundo rustica]